MDSKGGGAWQGEAVRERRSGREEQKGEEDKVEERGACRRKEKADVKKWNEWVMEEEGSLPNG